MKFEPHGEYELWVRDSVVYAKLFGAWNKEAAIQFSDEFKHLAASLGSKWGHYVDLTQWELCNAEVFSVVEELVVWCIENGLTRAAQVYPPSIIKTQFIDQMVVEEQGQFQRAVFGDIQSACNWLTEEGYPATVTDRR